MKRVSLKTLATIFVSAFLMVVVAKPLVAQVAPKPQELDEKQLRSFAKVYVQVEKIRQEYEPRAKEATGPEEGKQIQQEAQSKFQQVLTKEGLTEESYTKIFEVARADQDVRKKILQMIGEEKAKS
jgi:flagellar motor protein MotB